MFLGQQQVQMIELCSCEDAVITLVRLGLWPATPIQPKVAFTFDFMLHLRALILECQISLQSFCTAMQHTRLGPFEASRLCVSEYCSVHNIMMKIYW